MPADEEDFDTTHDSLEALKATSGGKAIMTTVENFIVVGMTRLEPLLKTLGEEAGKQLINFAMTTLQAAIEKRLQ